MQFYAETVANPDLMEAQGNGWKRSLAYNDVAEIQLADGVAFGSVEVGKTAQREFTMKNLGTARLNVSEVTFPVGFTGNLAIGEVPAGEERTVQVNLAPSAEQAYSGSIEVLSNARRGISSFVVSGEGVWPLYSIQVSAGPGGVVNQLGSVAVRQGESFQFQLAAGEGGRVEPSGDVPVDCGGGLLLIATPDTRYEVGEWRVDGAVVAACQSSLNLANIVAPCLVEVTFTRRPDPTPPTAEVRRNMDSTEIAVRCRGPAGQHYELEASVDLKDWTSVAVLTTDTSGVSPELSVPSDGAARFFRVRLAP